MTKSNKDSQLSRRAALVGLGALGTSAAIASCKSEWTPAEGDPYGLAHAKPYVPGAEAWATGEERWASTSCAQCAAACGIRVRVVEGRAVRIEGNKDNPLNRGGIGVRGIAGLQVLYDPDRITGPLLRKNGELTKVTWEEALAVVADGLKKLREQDKAHRLLIMSGRERGMMNELLQRFGEAYGTPDFVDGRANRSSVIAQAMEESFNSFEVPAYDWAGASFILSLEAGLLEDSCQAVSFVRTAAEREQGTGTRRSTLVHAGPAFDLTASSADQWIRLQPGSAGALALGLCRELLNTESYDRRAVEARTLGFEEFLEAVQVYTPERVSELSGVPPDQIVRLAAALARNSPAFAYIDDRSVAFSNGRETALAVFALNAILGAVEAQSGGMRIAPEAPTKAWPSVSLDARAKAGIAMPRMDHAGTREFPRARSVPERLIEAMEKQAPEAALLYYTNPAYARHQPDRWRAALQKIPLIVSFSPFLDETTQELAHVVLPDHTYLERFEDAAPAPGLTRAVLGVRKPVVVPLHNTRASGDLVLELSQRIGGTVAASLPWKSFREAVDARLLGLHEANRGSIRAASELEFLERIYESGVWSDSAAAEPASLRLPLSGQWTEAQWVGKEARFPLKLILYRPLGHAEGSGANQPWLHTLRPRPGARAWDHAALVHPSTAQPWADGDVVTIASAWGQVAMPIRFERRMIPGFVAIAMGRGHSAYGRFAKGIGVNAMILAAPGAAAITGASVLCNTRVRLQGKADDHA